MIAPIESPIIGTAPTKVAISPAVIGGRAETVLDSTEMTFWLASIEGAILSAEVAPT